jgi:cytochrome c oxidase subunit 2
MSLRPVSYLRALSVGLGGAILLAVTGCQQLADHTLPQTTVVPSSDLASMVTNLYVLIFIMAAVVFVGVEGFLVYAIIRFRRRGPGDMPRQVHGNTRLEIAWTLLPALVLLVIAVPTISTIFASDAVPPTATQRIHVIAHQWWWEFRYPDLNIVTANELHLPVNQTAVFELETADVIHSFWFPRVGGKMDVMPARNNHLWFTPQEIGEFYGQCVEFCGVQHANMRMRLFVDSTEDFNRWAQQQAADAPNPIGATADRGARAFQGSGCAACHTIRGTQARGQIGPDLTHVGSRKTIAAGILDNTAANMSMWIKDAQGVKPGNKMVVAAPSASDLTDIVAYLQSLR